jgi:hypothetical protein
LALDKPIALRSVKPLYCSLCLHFHNLACATPTRLGPATLELLCFSWSVSWFPAGELAPAPPQAS